MITESLCFFLSCLFKCVIVDFRLTESVRYCTNVVHSKLDYCSSLYHNLPKSQITRLQQIQISLARAMSKLPNPVTLSDATKTALKSTYEHAIWLHPCCGLHPLTEVSGDSAAQMPYRLSRRGAQLLLSPNVSSVSRCGDITWGVKF